MHNVLSLIGIDDGSKNGGGGIASAIFQYFPQKQTDFFTLCIHGHPYNIFSDQNKYFPAKGRQ
jgi:hypothetical protein